MPRGNLISNLFFKYLIYLNLAIFPTVKSITQYLFIVQLTYELKAELKFVLEKNRWNCTIDFLGGTADCFTLGNRMGSMIMLRYSSHAENFHLARGEGGVWQENRSALDSYVAK